MNALCWQLAILATRLRRGLHVIAPQAVSVDDLFVDTDRILDLGGGGEGVIGRLRGNQVTAVDIRQGELDDAPEGPVKVVADARNLPFPDASFDAVTAFFFLMYVAAADRPQVLAEARRVLVPGGSLHVWDVAIPAPDARSARTFVVPVRAKLPDGTVRTAYGVPWEGRKMSADGIGRIAQRTGLIVTAAQRYRETFHLVLSRPG